MTINRRQSGYPAVRRAAVIGGVDVPVGIRPVTIMSGQAGALSPEQGMFVRLPGANFAPAGSTPVNAEGDAVIAAGATGLLLTVNVPDGQRFTLAGIGFGAADETSTQFLTWTIFVGPNPVPGYINKSAVIGTLFQLGAVNIVLPASQPITIQGACALAAGTHLGLPIAYDFYVRVSGWFYAEQEVS